MLGGLVSDVGAGDPGARTDSLPVSGEGRPHTPGTGSLGLGYWAAIRLTTGQGVGSGGQQWEALGSYGKHWAAIGIDRTRRGNIPH